MQGVVSMLNNPTVEKLRDLKLKVMAQMVSEPDAALRDLSFEERLGIMVEKEWLAKKNARIQRLLHRASLGLNACIEDIDYTVPEPQFYIRPEVFTAPTMIITMEAESWLLKKVHMAAASTAIITNILYRVQGVLGAGLQALLRGGGTAKNRFNG